jgi:thiamine-phosphate pyrophosphorylase
LAGLRLGLSTHGYAEMIRAESFGPSYLALGAVFPTTLKRMATPPQGLGRLRVYAQLMSHHTLVGIGGIDQSQFAAVQDCGVGSVAVVRAIVAQTDPVQAARELMSALR